MSEIRLANAPVSYGVFGTITVEGAATPAGLLTTMANAGYGGSELGPPWFFGQTPAQTQQVFHDAGLEAVGAYIPLHTQDRSDVLERDLERMRHTFDELVATGGGLAIFADEGDETLLAHPRHAPQFALDDEGWRRLIDVVERARKEAMDRGLETSFHPHISTYVEQPTEIERLLEHTEVGLTYDVGHVVMAGGDAVADFTRWNERVNHIHVKDVTLSVFEQAVASGRSDFDQWWATLCPELGHGDIDLRGFLAQTLRCGYDGWYVVEQDRAPLAPGEFPPVRQSQERNLRWLRTTLEDLSASR